MTRDRLRARVGENVAASMLDGEKSLDHQLSQQEWEQLESEFLTANMMLTVSIDAPSVPVADRGYWGFTEFISGIQQVCTSRGVHMNDDGLRPTDSGQLAVTGRAER